ncbi:Methyl-directed repair DNA adenine methylase [Candidatus Rhodobacter oscarellae]|uniref:Site-specific DNA-methyltransferase (adenine-specific) n=1 Tax=Candidatus Rhodobacter oscarellae TaxID=1675527 RepID=A0A0J9E4H5_9RHOB|nr:Dam family site-specific DNA-(adenine-N6)-methyltransferase [Candidatus Rhodobacter lobularis]KMW57695.1 Methyl-directed repair DNA adenine methylase [Candidatus Rhodobacter lobularis]
MGKKNVVPFLKWAGGKRWLVEQQDTLFDISFERYIEPFLGSGSVFFSIQPSNAILSDANARLIECYKSIQKNYARIEELLRDHHKNHSNEYYYEVRSASFGDPTERAAQFIYLNRTCFNGLYRVNLKGQFNVPIGTKTSVVLPTDKFAKISDVLKNIQLNTCDFEETISKAGAGDLVYLDPPYTVKHNYNGFLKYNEKIFSWDDQVRLKDCAAAAASRGATVIISNAAHSSLRELYQDARSVKTVRRSSVLAASSAKRGCVEEILVVF